MSRIAPSAVTLLLLPPVGIAMIVFMILRGLGQLAARRRRTTDWRSMTLDKQGLEDFEMELQERMLTVVNVGQPVWPRG